MPTPPAYHTDPRDLLRDHSRRLADLVAWDRSVGDDAPRFGLMFRDKTDEVVVAARRLAAHPTLSGDVDLGRSVVSLGDAAARGWADPTFNREVIAAAHEVAERAEDLLGITW
ncbi:hypothetical protein [Cellulomonas sp. PS-H5]|uniref:hypothetical protein n=1 Tax=Cellulomonas sp. PS-H5 TaxID=2820400 RepID=UPI001C4EEA92|nr:hypothetical protein [Cellulomonas sp. PS-H5]MBW0252848.1 hypothetical protein [Cellulomonas sp. PS-H5]